jgi:small-conductance mechanosensitive channel
VLLVLGAVVNGIYGRVRRGNFDHRVVALAGILVFIVFANLFLRVLTSTIRRAMITHHLGTGRAAAVQFILRMIGYVVILLCTLELLGIPIDRLLLGGAALSIVLSVAAQQALANFFASIVLVISHPFTVGEEITLKSGALGGEYNGTVIDIGLTHTKLQDKDGKVTLMPNASLLSGAAILVEKRVKSSKRKRKSP